MVSGKAALAQLPAGLSLAVLILALLAMACTMDAPRDATLQQPAAPQAVEASAPEPAMPDTKVPDSNVPDSNVMEKAAPASAAAQPAAASAVLATSQDEASKAILVSGQGEASAAPDVATIVLGIEASGATVREARNTAAAAMQEMMDVLKQRRIEDDDIQTSRLSIHPKYGTRTVTRCPEGEDSAGEKPTIPEAGISVGPEMPKGQECFTERESVIIGYEVNHQVMVQLRDLDAVGDVIDEVTDAGGDLARFQSISFSLDDPKPLQTQALANAIEDAQAKAEHMAAESGVSLGDLIRISEGSAPSDSPYGSFGRQAFALESAAVMAAPTTVSGGEVTVAASVTAMYGIE